MIRFSSEHHGSLRALRVALDRGHCDTVLRCVRGPLYGFAPHLGGDARRFVREIARLPAETRTLLTLFVLGREVAPLDAQAALAPARIDDLVDLGLLRRTTAGVATDGYRILGQNDQYFVLSSRTEGGVPRTFKVYAGHDSLFLLRYLDRTRRVDRALDLCSGSGIVGQGLAPWADEVVAVELEDEAVEVSRVNAVLNGLDTCWEVRPGDLWDPVAGERFDLVVANPPFVAVPLDVPFPAFGWGGEDGLRFVRRILTGLPEHLRPGGRARIILENPGGVREPTLMPALREMADGEPTWAVTALVYDRILISRATLSPFAETVAQLDGDSAPDRIATLIESFARAFGERGLRYVYRVLLTVDTGPRDRGGLTVLPLFNPWDEEDTPSVAAGLTVRTVPRFCVSADGGEPLEIGEVHRRLADRIDGRTTLREAAREVWREHRENGGDLPLGVFVADALDLCRVLEQRGFLEPPPTAERVGAFRA